MTSSSSTVTTITCSSRCCIRSRPPHFRPPTSPRRSAPSCAVRQMSPSCSRMCRASMSLRKAVIAEDRRIPYDILVLATGAQHAYFGHDDWAAFAPGLKTIDDATYLRRRILLAFERAEAETDAAERARLLTFVVVGGGPTGVEMAGAIAELAKWALAARLPQHRSAQRAHHSGRRRPAPARRTRPSLSEKARRSLEKLGVEVRLERDGDRRAVHRMCASAPSASKRARSCGPLASRRRPPPNGSVRQPTGPGGSRSGLISPCRAIRISSSSATRRSRSMPDGKPLPGVAPVAKQQGQYRGEAI